MRSRALRMAMFDECDGIRAGHRPTRYNHVMSDSILGRVPVVGGLAYIETVRRLPGSFTATLQTEPDNRYFRHAIAVRVNGEKVGYVAPEVAVEYYEVVEAATIPLTCPGRPARHSDHETSGVELLLDFKKLPTDRPGNGSP